MKSSTFPSLLVDTKTLAQYNSPRSVLVMVMSLGVSHTSLELNFQIHSTLFRICRWRSEMLKRPRISDDGNFVSV